MTTPPDEVIREVYLRESSSQTPPRYTLNENFDTNLSKWFSPDVFAPATISASMAHLHDAGLQALFYNYNSANMWQNYTTRARIKGTCDTNFEGFGICSYANKDSLDGYMVMFFQYINWFILYAAVHASPVLIVEGSLADFGITLEADTWFETGLNIRTENGESGPENHLIVDVGDVEIANAYAPADYFFTRGAPGIVKTDGSEMDCDWIEVPS